MSYLFSLDVSAPRERVGQSFQENKEVFEKIKEYYSDFEYSDIVKTSRKEINIDNICYYFQKNEDSYVLDLNLKSYNNFKELIIDGSDLKDICEGLYSIYVGIDKETYEVKSIGVCYSIPNWDISIRYDKEEDFDRDFSLSLGDDWYVYAIGRGKLIGEKEVREQILDTIYLIIMVVLTIYVLCGWIYCFIKGIIKIYKLKSIK